MLILAGELPDKVSAAAARSLKAIGAEVETEDGGVRPDLRGHEHFGFDDGGSQPRIRGKASDGAGVRLSAHVAARLTWQCHQNNLSTCVREGRLYN